MNIIYYLQATKHVGLVFRGGDVNLECWVDAGFNQDEVASCQYGYGFRLSPEDAFFFSVSRKIGLAVTSSTQAEYVAMYEAAREASWLRRFLAELGFTQQGPTSMFEDNEPCITQVTGQVLNFQATKHYLPKYMYTRELYAEGSIDLVYVETQNQIADIFTKPLSTTLFQKFTAELLCITLFNYKLTTSPRCFAARLAYQFGTENPTSIQCLPAALDLWHPIACSEQTPAQ